MVKMILDYLKFIFQKLISSKYVRKGKCNYCGNCCRNILLYSKKNLPIVNENQFKQVQKWDKHFYNFYISGKSEDGALLFSCRWITKENKCRVYFLRGLGCRQYPKANSEFLINGGKPLDGCGYFFEPDKPFKDYL